MAQQVQDKIALKITPEYTSYSPGGQEKCWATATMTAPFYEPTSRSEIDLVAVIDRSGSMGGSKIELVKETLVFIIDQLKEKDRFCLVSYASDVTVDMPLTHMSKEEKESAKVVVNGLQATTSTALCDGLITGMQQVIKRTGEMAKVASVLLLTDGQANVGPSSKAAILDAMKNPTNYGDPGASYLRKAVDSVRHLFSTPVPFDGTIYTFGFGSDHDAGLLEAISQAAEGAYYYIDTAEKIPESFADCLGGLMSVVGQNMEISLTCTNGCSMSDVNAKNPAKMSDRNTKCVVQLGDLQSEEERDVVLEITLPATGEEHSDWMVVSAKLTYFNVISSMMEDIQFDLKVHRKQEDSQRPNQAVLVQKMRISSLRSLKEARELGEKGNLEQARTVIKSAIAAIEKSELTEHKLIKYLLGDLKDILESYSSVDSYRGYGSKKIANVYQSNMQQRSQSSGPNAYENQARMFSKAAYRDYS